MNERLDILLVRNKTFPSRERARNAIEQGCVQVNGKVILKAGKQVSPDDVILATDPLKYVSKGGLKLEKAIKDFGLDFTGKWILDIGASTGGFTDCSLQHKAEFVYAIDVGSRQLHLSLANHPKVKSIENKDIRDITTSELDHRKMDFILVDVSFISLRHIFPLLDPFISPSGSVLLLVKPQFEAGAQSLNKNGIVKKPEDHVRVIAEIISTAENLQWFLHGLTPSPIREGKNIEYLSLFRKEKSPSLIFFREVVSKAFAKLNERSS